jgi:hypothetical protein
MFIHENHDTSEESVGVELHPLFSGKYASVP